MNKYNYFIETGFISLVMGVLFLVIGFVIEGVKVVFR